MGFLLPTHLNPDQVVVFPWVARALLRLNLAGYGLAIVTNQPSAAKKKTSLDLLNATHSRVLSEIQSEGAVILSSHICFHRSEDKCSCRKPLPGLLQAARDLHPQFAHEQSWMIGDGITDVQAGATLGLKTAFFGPKKCDHCLVLENKDLVPHFWGKNILTFTDFLLGKESPST